MNINILVSLIFCVIHYPAAANEKELIILFPPNVRSERDLPVCESAYTVCSLFQRRFWLPSIIHRHCRCPDRSNCPSDWSETFTDSRNSTTGTLKTGLNYSLPLNNRAQLKFCEDVGSLPVCLPSQTAALHETVNSGPGMNTTETAKVECRCPTNHVWTRHDTNTENKSTNQTGSLKSVSTHRCLVLKRCRSRESCGFITVDTFSSYYRCSCASGSKCVINNRSLHQIHELFYKGPAYFGKCKQI